MKNSESAAFPFLETEAHNSEFGLTKREYFAIEILKGLISSGKSISQASHESGNSRGLRIKESINLADELLNELESTKNHHT